MHTYIHTHLEGVPASYMHTYILVLYAYIHTYAPRRSTGMIIIIIVQYKILLCIHQAKVQSPTQQEERRKEKRTLHTSTTKYYAVPGGIAPPGLD
jgi:hypothetical protein